MEPMTGRAVFEGLGGPGFREILGGGFGAEIIYSFVIIICSLMIYFGTKEIYELSSYKGIKYFRKAFLFFAIAYFFRSFIKFMMMYFNLREIFEFSPGFFGGFTLFLFMYFSAMAMFYLLYSLIWRKWSINANKIYIAHGLALIIAVTSITIRNQLVYFGINILLLAFIVLVVYAAYKNQKNKLKSHNLYAVYLMLFVFWIFNIIDILVPNFLQTFKLLIYLISSGIFLLILYKVLKKAGAN